MHDPNPEPHNQLPADCIAYDVPFESHPQQNHHWRQFRPLVYRRSYRPAHAPCTQFYMSTGGFGGGAVSYHLYARVMMRWDEGTSLWLPSLLYRQEMILQNDIGSFRTFCMCVYGSFGNLIAELYPCHFPSPPPHLFPFLGPTLGLINVLRRADSCPCESVVHAKVSARFGRFCIIWQPCVDTVDSED